MRNGRGFSRTLRAVNQTGNVLFSGATENGSPGLTLNESRSSPPDDIRIGPKAINQFGQVALDDGPENVVIHGIVSMD